MAARHARRASCARGQGWERIPQAGPGNQGYSRPWVARAAMVFVVGWAGAALAQCITVDPSARYYRNAAGQPVFLIGYYDWAAVPDTYYIDQCCRYADMIQRGSAFKINYLRISLGVNRFVAPERCPDATADTPVPFLYVNGKADLDQWDPVFWAGLRSQCQLARNQGMIVHVSLFDGVELRGCGAGYTWSNSFWNVNNQVRSFYGDVGNGCSADGNGLFYRLPDFNNNTGVGFYQRKLIDKALSETAACDNVFYEVGNELLGAPCDWYAAVIAYMKARTCKPVTQEQNPADNCTDTACKAGNQDGWSQHTANDAIHVKCSVAALVGKGYPAWEDPDGPRLSDYGISPDELRQAAWYSFAGGAAGWGGFTVDFWHDDFNVSTVTYYKNLQQFIQQSGVQFWNMVPRHDLVNNSSVNSCMANVGYEYVVYVAGGASVDVNLTGVAGSLTYCLYNPVTNCWEAPQSVAGGGVRTFAKPDGASDWVVYIGPGSGPVCQPVTPPVTLGQGITPGVATDTQGHIHVVYMSGSSIYYRKGDPDGQAFTDAEAVPTPDGPAEYNSPHVLCDPDGVPHVHFLKGWYPDSVKSFYTNRTGGIWKAPIPVFDRTGQSAELVLVPRLALYRSGAQSYAFATASISNDHPPNGMIARISNLGTAPQVDSIGVVGTYWSPYPVVGRDGILSVVGRNGPAGHWIERFDLNASLNLTARDGGRQILGKGATCLPNKTAEPTAAAIDRANVVHAVALCGQTGIDPDDLEMCYNNTQKLASADPCGVPGLPLPPGAGWPDDDQWPHLAFDASGKLYMAYRDYITGEGRIGTISNNQFAAPMKFADQLTHPSQPHRRRWNAQLAPTLTGGVWVAWDNNNTCYLRPWDKGTFSGRVSIDLGDPDAPDCLVLRHNDDGDTAPATVGGRTCRRNTDWTAGDYYFYFDVCDSFAFNCDRPEVYISLDYFDSGSGTLALEYDACGAIALGDHYRLGGTIALTNANTWKHAVFHLADAGFGNGQNAGADFRIGSVGCTFYLDKVAVSLHQPVPPAIAEVGPEPRTVVVGLPYSEQLVLLQGSAPVSWRAIQPQGLLVSATGLVSGWTPAAADLVAPYRTFEVEASNFEGADTESWAVHVVSRMDFDRDDDVDQDDFGLFQRCLSGSGVTYPSGCGSADVSADGDVDQDDLNLFRACFGGPGRTPGC